MSDFSAVPFESETLSEQVESSWLAEAWTFLGGLLLTSVLSVIGAALVTVALVVGVVGAPTIAAAVAYVVVRSRRAAAIGANRSPASSICCSSKGSRSPARGASSRKIRRRLPPTSQ